MQIDNDLLQSLTPNSPITLRLYRWAAPTLSLGHFQLESDISADWPVQKADRVRRKTGGGAILHDLEWTYSLVIPDNPSLSKGGIGLKGHSEEIYRAVHNSVVDGLRELGWDAALSEECTCSLKNISGDLDPFLCFLRRSPVDVVVGTDKILGSAQRRAKSGLLQHGSFVLNHSKWTPELRGILDIPRYRLETVGFKNDATRPMVSGVNCADSNRLDNLNLAGKRTDSLTDISVFPFPSEDSPLFAAKSHDLVDARAGLWLAKQIMIGVDRIFRCNWRLA